MSGQVFTHERHGIAPWLRGVAIALMVASPAYAQDEGSEELVGALIEQLGDADFQARQDAEAALTNMGPVVLDALQAAGNHPSPEVRNRAQRVVQEILNPSLERRNEMRQQAWAALLRGDYAVMLRYQEHLVQLVNPPAHDLIWLGHVHRLTEQWPRAVEAYEKALALVMAKRARMQEEAAAGARVGMVADPQGVVDPRPLALRIGLIRRDMLDDLPGAEAAFTALVAEEPLLQRSADDLLAEWVERGGEPPRRSTPINLSCLRALHGLAVAHLRMNKPAEAAEELARFNLLQLLNFTDAREADVETLARIVRDWPANEPLPTLPGVTVLTPEQPRVSFDVSQSASRETAAHLYRSRGSGDYRQRTFAFVPPSGKEFAELELEVTAERGRRWIEAAVKVEGLVAGRREHVVELGKVSWTRRDPADVQTRTERFPVPSGIALARLDVEWAAEGFMPRQFALRATLRDRGEWHDPPAPAWGVADGLFTAEATDLRFEQPLRQARRASLAKLKDGKWLMVFVDADQNLRSSTSADGRNWSPPERLPFSRFDAVEAVALCADDAGDVWLAFRSDRLGAVNERTGSQFILWLTRSTDGQAWLHPRPVQAEDRRGDDTIQLLQSPDGRCRMVYLDQIGAADGFDKLTGLTSLNFKQKFGHQVEAPYLTLDDTGRFHLIFRGARNSIFHASSDDGHNWFEPVQLIDGPSNGYPRNPQLVLSGRRGAVLYEDVAGDAWLRRVGFGEPITVSGPVKIADKKNPLAGARLMPSTPEQVTLTAGDDAVWLLRAEKEQLLNAAEPPAK